MLQSLIPGSVYVWGKVLSASVFGLGPDHALQIAIDDAKKIPNLPKIIDIAAGAYSCFLIDEDNKLYSFGMVRYRRWRTPLFPRVRSSFFSHVIRYLHSFSIFLTFSHSPTMVNWDTITNSNNTLQSMLIALQLYNKSNPVPITLLPCTLMVKVLLI